jgi:hypothetical protein
MPLRVFSSKRFLFFVLLLVITENTLSTHAVLWGTVNVFATSFNIIMLLLMLETMEKQQTAAHFVILRCSAG